MFYTSAFTDPACVPCGITVTNPAMVARICAQAATTSDYEIAAIWATPSPDRPPIVLSRQPPMTPAPRRRSTSRIFRRTVCRLQMF
jgi:hypothetical protein